MRFLHTNGLRCVHGLTKGGRTWGNLLLQALQRPLRKARSLGSFNVNLKEADRTQVRHEMGEGSIPTSRVRGRCSCELVCSFAVSSSDYRWASASESDRLSFHSSRHESTYVVARWQTMSKHRSSNSPTRMAQIGLNLQRWAFGLQEYTVNGFMIVDVMTRSILIQFSTLRTYSPRRKISVRNRNTPLGWASYT